MHCSLLPLCCRPLDPCKRCRCPSWRTISPFPEAIRAFIQRQRREVSETQDENESCDLIELTPQSWLHEIGGHLLFGVALTAMVHFLRFVNWDQTWWEGKQDVGIKSQKQMAFHPSLYSSLWFAYLSMTSTPSSVKIGHLVFEAKGDSTIPLINTGQLFLSSCIILWLCFVQWFLTSIYPFSHSSATFSTISMSMG